MLTTEIKDHLWKLRQSQNLAELMPVLSELKLRYPDDQEIQCLEASLKRSRGKIRESRLDLKKIRESEKENLNPRVFMEEGLNYLYLGDSYNGLEKFLSCYSLIKDSDDETPLKLQSLINAMISLDNLGQNYSYTENEFLKVTGGKVIPAGYLAAIDMLNLYRNFREGKLSLIDSKSIQGFSQAKFFKCYMNLLPYQRYYYPNTVKEELELFYTRESNLYLKSYRLRTLQKNTHPEDADNKKISEVVDRLYLWLWNFMVSPSKSDWDRLVITIDQLEKLSSSHLSVDDSEKLQCTVGWLSLLDPQFDKLSDKFLGIFKLTQGGDFHKVHQIEKLLISYLKALHRGEDSIAQDYLMAFKLHPLYDDPDLFFRSFVEEESFGTKDLQDIVKLFFQTNESSLGASLVIDLNHNKITSGSDVLVSQNLSLAFDLFFRKENLTIEEFFFEVFGIEDFDPINHNSKLYTLLWRMKKNSPDGLDFKVKEGRVFSQGSWSEVAFIKLPLVTSIMRLKNPHFYKNYSDRKSVVSIIKKEKIETLESLLSIGESLSRLEMEKRLNRSRPTCNRLINKWRDEGVLEAVGKGPTTRYILAKNVTRLS